MHRRTSTWPRLAATLILTIGIAVIWGTLVAWTISLAEQYWRINGGVYESLQVTMDGTPVVVSRSFADHLDASYRTLDGQPLPNQRELWLPGASLLESTKPPRLWETPVDWSARVAGLGDPQRPPVGWYVIRDDQPVGRAYLVGYDEFSKLRIGYFGRGGFRGSLPPKEEWFDIGRRRLNWGTLATTGSVQFGGRSATYASAFSVSDALLSTSILFLIDGDRLLEIDWRAKSLRTIFESPEIVSVAGLLELLPRPADERATPEPAIEPPSETARANTFIEAASALPLVTRIAIRTTEQIIILESATGTKREYTLPDVARDQSIQVFAIGGGRLFLVWWSIDSRLEPELAWLAADGSITRQEKLALASQQAGPSILPAIITVLAAPIPIGWLGGIFLGGPVTQLQTNQATTYSEALAQGLELGWCGLIIVVILLGAVLAWWAYRFQRKYHRPASGMWCAFVFLLGWPAFLAYWIEHRRPKLETCNECGTVVPRDREACAACRTVFPAPQRLGTEIFA